MATNDKNYRMNGMVVDTQEAAMQGLIALANKVVAFIHPIDEAEARRLLKIITDKMSEVAFIPVLGTLDMRALNEIEDATQNVMAAHPDPLGHLMAFLLAGGLETYVEQHWS